MEISNFLKMSLLIDGIIAIIYGLVMLLIPETHANLMGFPHEEFAGRMIGTLFIGFGVGNFLAWMKATSWEQVEFVVIMNITFFGLAAIVMIYSMAVALIPITGLFQTGLVLFLLILFLYAYYMAKMKSG
jgi:hypothetical protein